METKDEGLFITPKNTEQALVPTPQANTPMSLIAMAVAKGADINTIERLVALQERMEAKRAEMAFNDAMNKAQKGMGPVNTDLENPQTRSKYASYWALDKRVRPIYTANGFSLSFDTGDTDKQECVRVLCYVSHNEGHTRTYHIDMPADGKGAKGGDVMTKTHATGAAMSYGKRYLLKDIFNIAIGEEDTDGNAISMGEVAEQCEWIENAKDMNELQKLYITAYKAAAEVKDKAAMHAYIAAKDKRKKELQ
jgi:hypothetical protein